MALRTLSLRLINDRRTQQALVAVVLVALSALLVPHTGLSLLVLVFIGISALLLLHTPSIGPLVLVGAALAIPLQIKTGTDVTLNTATLLIPILFVPWLLDAARKKELHWAASPINRPLGLFLGAGLLSLLIGNVLWDNAIPRSGHFWLVQLAQWSIFAFAAIAVWLTGNLLSDERLLSRLVWFFLYFGGILATLQVIPGVTLPIMTTALNRAPFWMLLATLAEGQLLFNHKLSLRCRLYLLFVLAVVVYYAFFLQRAAISNWVGVVVATGALVWFRFPRQRSIIVTVLTILIVTGIFFPSIYRFAGGEEEWTGSGGSRLALINRVISVSLRNPITGLGPASYRLYANAAPLRYRNTLWWNPNVNSHNNYVDLFAHTGLLGLGLFLWFAWELLYLGRRLNTHYQDSFVGGFVSSITAAWIGSLVLMLLADWLLPFVYNVGFPGFQSSLLIWLFLGGLVAVDNWTGPEKNIPAETNGPIDRYR